LEWPGELSIDLPAHGILVRAGIPLVISRFRDDTIHHHELADRAQIASAIYDSRGVVEGVGMTRYRWLEEGLLVHWQSGNADQCVLRATHWSRTKWSLSIVAGRQSSTLTDFRLEPTRLGAHKQTRLRGVHLYSSVCARTMLA
jgi:hypothetical protein